MAIIAYIWLTVSITKIDSSIVVDVLRSVADLRTTKGILGLIWWRLKPISFLIPLCKSLSRKLVQLQQSCDSGSESPDWR